MNTETFKPGYTKCATMPVPNSAVGTKIAGVGKNFDEINAFIEVAPISLEFRTYLLGEVASLWHNLYIVGTLGTGVKGGSN